MVGGGSLGGGSWREVWVSYMNLMYVRKSSFLGDSHKENAPMINHTLGKKNIVAYALS